MSSIQSEAATQTPGRSSQQHRVVIVGGGAAGLELATSLGRNRRLAVTLVDKSRAHVWKPKLHEIAAGSMDPGRYEVGYLAHARKHRFTYRMGEMTGLDRAKQEIHVAAFVDVEGDQITPARTFGYDTLILAVGSRSNDFGTPGVEAHALKLESLHDAREFNRRLVNACFRAQSQEGELRPEQLRVAIIGAGATGVELAAELHHTARDLLSQNEDGGPSVPRLGITLVEAADRILPALPPRLSCAATIQLEKDGVTVMSSAKVSEVQENGVVLADGRRISAEITVWAAGVRAPAFLREIDGLETNRLNQLVVRRTLQTSLDERIFAIGDCAACPRQSGEGFVPPRAQAAHQQASFLAKNFHRVVNGGILPHYSYRDFGSLVSLGKFSTVGNLMGGVMGRNMWVEGAFARLMYVSMYKMHELALHGLPAVMRETVARAMTPSKGSRVKLH